MFPGHLHLQEVGLRKAALCFLSSGQSCLQHPADYDGSSMCSTAALPPAGLLYSLIQCVFCDVYPIVTCQDVSCGIAFLHSLGTCMWSCAHTGRRVLHMSCVICSIPSDLVRLLRADRAAALWTTAADCVPVHHAASAMTIACCVLR